MTIVKGHRNKPCQEVPEVDEFAVLLVFDIDNAPTRLAPPHRLAVNDHSAFLPNDCKRNHVLEPNRLNVGPNEKKWGTHPDTLIELNLFVVVLLGIERIQTDVVVIDLRPNLANNEQLHY